MKRRYPVRVKTVIAAVCIAVAVLSAGACANGASHVLAPCSGERLAGTFKVVPGSAGAGNIVYRLTVTNTSAATCTLTGLPLVKLYGKTGKALPTHSVPAFRPGLTAVLIRLAPHAFAHATARFSPDVPGPGEGGRAQCEPRAFWLHLTGRTGGLAKIAVKPPTPVCEHGQLQLSVYGPGR
jgi:hypothetical protein